MAGSNNKGEAGKQYTLFIKRGNIMTPKREEGVGWGMF